MAALFPAAVRINGERVACGIAGDLALDPAHRTLGPALLLGTSLLDLLPQSEFRFVYALPNPAAEPVFRRLRYTELGRMTRFVKLFKTEFAVQALLTRPTLAKGFPKLLDPLVSAIARERWRRRDVSLQFTMGSGFDARFDPLWNTLLSGPWIVGERSPALLNWKYETGEPTGQFRLLCAQTGESIRGYAVTQDRLGVRHVLDIIFDSGSVLDELLTELSQQARRDGLAALCVDYFGARSKLTSRLRAFGFFRRAGRPLMIFVPQGSSVSVALRRENWALFAGDEDV